MMVTISAFIVVAVVLYRHDQRQRTREVVGNGDQKGGGKVPPGEMDISARHRDGPQGAQSREAEQRRH